jgi:hypothetical protein
VREVARRQAEQIEVPGEEVDGELDRFVVGHGHDRIMDAAVGGLDRMAEDAERWVEVLWTGAPATVSAANSASTRSPASGGRGPVGARSSARRGSGPPSLWRSRW